MITATPRQEIEKRTMDKVSRRLVPFLMLCYFIAYVDRVNISFAGGPMSKDLHLSQAAFGGAAGIFFIAYSSLKCRAIWRSIASARAFGSRASC